MTTLIFLVHYKDGALRPFTIHQKFSSEVPVSILIKDNTFHPFSFRWLKPLWLFYPNVGKTEGH